MAVQKNFVIKNGLEVNEALIFADRIADQVGIGTTSIDGNCKMEVLGNVKAENLYLRELVGVGSIYNVKGNTLDYYYGRISSGVVTSIVGTSLTYTSGTVNNLFSVSGIVSSVSGTGLTYTNGSITNVDGTNLWYDNGYFDQTSHKFLYNSVGLITDLVGTAQTYQRGTINNLYTVSGIITTLSGTSVTFTNSELTSLVGTYSTYTNSTAENLYARVGVVTDLVGTAVTYTTGKFLGSVDIDVNLDVNSIRLESGTIAASSGIVTYYGDGNYLDLSTNASTGIGIGTTGGLVGYGVTFLNLYGSGVSTAYYNQATGICTVFIGGGSGGSVSIGTVAPPAPRSGDLWYSTEYARMFVFFNEPALGTGGSAKVWVDASPFNVGIISALSRVSFDQGTNIYPAVHFDGDVSTGFFSPTPGQFNIVSSASTILNVNPAGINVVGVASVNNKKLVNELTAIAYSVALG